MGTSRKRPFATLHTVGWVSAVLAAIIAVIIVSSNGRQRRALAARVEERNLLKMRATQDLIEDYMSSVWHCLQVFSLDPEVAGISTQSYRHLQGLFEADYALHRLAEVYIVGRDFDGLRRPAMSFEVGGQDRGDAGLHTLDRESQELAVQLEHIRRFAEDPRVAHLVSLPIDLCIGKRGIVCSLPVRSGGQLKGIVSGMVPTGNIAEVLEAISVGDGALLASETGTFLTCRGFSPKTRRWLKERFDEQGIRSFFDGSARSFRAAGEQVMWSRADIAGDGRWYVAYVYDSDAQMRGSGVQDAWEGWGIAATVILLGAAVMWLCNLVPALDAARTRSAAQARSLLESETRTRAIVDTAADGIITVDQSGVIESFNAAAQRIFGYASAEVVGQKVSLLLPSSRSVQCVKRLCGLSVGTGDGPTGAGREVEGRRKDGTRVPLEVNASEVRLPDRRLFTGLVRDISERKRAEQQARQRQAELAHVARLGTMGEMAAGLAHELNQPLSAIVNYIQVCQVAIRAGGVDSDELLADMEHAVDQAIRASEIIERLRNFVGRPKPQRTTVDFNRLIREVVELMDPEIKHSGVDVHIELDASLGSLEADAIQVQQVMVNLIKNGIEAMVDSGRPPRELTVQTLGHSRGLIECAIRDTGPGLSREAFDLVFTPFFTKKARGMGMGLPISRRIVEAHGGRLWGTPNTDRGATFRFTLPLGDRRSTA